MLESRIGVHRLVRQRITPTTLTSPNEVVAWMGALQGQDYAGAKWSFGLRLAHGTDALIEDAIAKRTILRTWALRGTLHYVAPADIHWLVALIAPRQIAVNALRYRQLELDEPTLERSTTLIAEALADGAHLTRTEVFAMLEANGMATGGQRGFYMLQRAGLERRIVQGEMRRNVTTFFALDEGKVLPKEEAVAQLARRYFISRGPATLADFTYWSGLLISEARAGLAAIQSELIEDEFEGQRYWLSPETPVSPQQELFLLPGFDEYMLGYKNREAILAPYTGDAICPGGNAVYMSTIVSDGRVIGTWKRAFKKKMVEITLNPFRPLRADEIDPMAEAAARYGAFLGLPVIIQSLAAPNDQ